MKSPTQQAIIFLLEEYLKQFETGDLYGTIKFVVDTPEEKKARELLEELKKS